MLHKVIHYIFLIILLITTAKVCCQEVSTKNLKEYDEFISDEERLKKYIRLGDLYRNNERYDSAFYYYNIATQLSNDSLSSSHIANCLNALGVYAKVKNSYAEAITCLIKALQIFENIKDKKGIAYCNANIGIVLAENNNYKKALKFFDKPIILFKEIDDKEGLVGSFINYGQVNLLHENFEQAEKYFLLALKILNENNIDYSLALIYDNLGCTYMEQGESSANIYERKLKFKKANNYLTKALFQHRLKNDLYGEAITLFDISTIYNKQKLYDKALKYADSSLSIARQADFLSIQMKTYENLSDIYKKLYNFEKALEYYTLFKQSNDSLFNVEKSKQLNELYLKFDTEKKQNEINQKNTQINLLEKEKEVVKYKMLGLLAFVIMTIIIALIIFISLKRRVKTNKQIYEHKMKYIETQKQIADIGLKNQKLQSLQLQNELKYKNQEITNLALHISERNEFLKRIQEELSKFSSIGETKAIIKFTNQNFMVLEKEKREFEEYIENINQAFYIKLREINSSISKNEERLAALLKLNLTSKEIATIFNISPKSVDMSRYRLRKKLNIDKDEKLVEYLNNL